LETLLRPYGLVIDGELEVGLELVIADGVIQEVRPHTGIPEPYVISPAFVNAHSHLEYRGLQGKLQSADYWPWIREITLAKREQSPSQVANDALLGAEENRRSGIAAIAEHSDRPVAGNALKHAGLDGVIFQELITRFDPEGPETRRAAATQAAARQAGVSGLPAFLIPHAFQTVDEETLRGFGSSGLPISMHVAESELENQLTEFGSGDIADTLRELQVPFTRSGKRLIPTLDELGLVRLNAQFVHCCAINEEEIDLLAQRGVTVAHCPRSNERLNCPAAPIREMLEAGILVGLGLDSPASSGPIDMFAEMRAALAVSAARGKPLCPEEVWLLATSMAADSIRFAAPQLPDWQIRAGSMPPLIQIHVPDAMTTDHLIEQGSPDRIAWVQPLEASP
jgi:cytosine/adenosine deaminase-related metal-dependent hydrolase